MNCKAGCFAVAEAANFLILIKEVIDLDGNVFYKQKILIADDSEMNRSILADMIGEEYEILEAQNGTEALKIISEKSQTISLILLDIVMPETDGFGVLAAMNENHYIESIPVIMISAESRPEFIEKAYNLGVTDFINRPFDMMIVRHRVVNTILLYSKQQRLARLVEKQIYEKERQSSIMIEILSHIVEFRNGESGSHVRNVRAFTRILLERLCEMSDKYNFTHKQIETISNASALHDIGKISIDEKILNKPGKLTESEFEKIKMHSVIADKMLEDLSAYDDDSSLIKTAREICRWHHERYDGKGYPDGLKGDEIPVSAQVVALADVYDALTSDRVYKKAITHSEAIKMIVDGKCGAFSPEIIKCLIDTQDALKHQIEMPSKTLLQKDVTQNVVDEILRQEDLKTSDRTFRLLEDERRKHEFFAALTDEVQFEFVTSPPGLKFTSFGAEKLCLPEYIEDPFNNGAILSVVSAEDLSKIKCAVMKTTPEYSETKAECQLNVNNEKRWCRIYIRSLWAGNDCETLVGVIGKIIDIHDSIVKMNNLKLSALSDTLTGILNHTGARNQISKRMLSHPEKNYALAIFDLDRFKDANDTYGHMFGDKVLCHVADKLKKNVRSEDIVARVGGDEFLIFFEYSDNPNKIIKRMFTSLCCKFEQFDISVSMGVALTENVGYEYDGLFKAADKALYCVKRQRRGDFRFYDDSMFSMFSVLSDIE